MKTISALFLAFILSPLTSSAYPQLNPQQLLGMKHSMETSLYGGPFQKGKQGVVNSKALVSLQFRDLFVSDSRASGVSSFHMSWTDAETDDYYECMGDAEIVGFDLATLSNYTSVSIRMIECYTFDPSLRTQSKWEQMRTPAFIKKLK